MIAALLRRCVERCRSRQFSEMFSFPPTNHFANGAFHSSTLLQRLRQVSSSASRAQNFCGCRIDSRCIRRYCSRLLIRAFCAKSFAGLKTRVSFKCDSMFFSSVFMGGVEASNRRLMPQRKLQTVFGL